MPGIIVTNRKRAVLSRRSVLNVGGAPCCCEPETPCGCECNPNDPVFRVRYRGCPLTSDNIIDGQAARVTRVSLSWNVFQALQASFPYGNERGSFRQIRNYSGVSTWCVTSAGATAVCAALEYSIMQSGGFGNTRGPSVAFESGDPLPNISVAGVITQPSDIRAAGSIRALRNALIQTGCELGPNGGVGLPRVDEIDLLPGVFVGGGLISTSPLYPGDGGYAGYPLDAPCNYDGSRERTRNSGSSTITDSQLVSFSRVESEESGSLYYVSRTEQGGTGGFSGPFIYQQTGLVTAQWRRASLLCGTGGSDALTVGPRGCADCGDRSRIIIE